MNKATDVHELEDHLGRPIGTFHLLSLGVENYDHHDSAINSLSDTQKIRGVLKNKFAFIDNPMAEDADATKLYREISKYTTSSGDCAKRLSENDFLVIWLSGHGHYYDGGTNQGYFIPKEGLNDPNDKNWISFSRVISYFKNIDANQILLIIDSCYSGTADKSIEPDERPISASVIDCLSKKGRWLLSSGKNEKVRGDGPNNCSPFTHAFLEAIKGLHAKNGVFSADQLYAYIREYFRNNTAYNQTPRYIPLSNTNSNGGEFVFIGKNPMNASSETAMLFTSEKEVYGINGDGEFSFLSHNVQNSERINVKPATSIDNSNSSVKLIFFVGSLVLIAVCALLLTNFPQTKLHDFLADGSPAPEMVIIPAGSIVVDKAIDNEGGSSGSIELSLNRRIAVSASEITWSDYNRCIIAGVCRQISNSIVISPDHENHPVRYVSRNDAQIYIDWLSNETSQDYRLLKSNEWEYAARAGNKEDNFGLHISPDIDYSLGKKGGSIMPVRSREPNEFGLYDMLGNVSEWTSDNHTDEHGNKFAIFRGGSRLYDQRANSKIKYTDPSDRLSYIGIRIAREID